MMSHQTSGDTYHDACLCNGHSGGECGDPKCTGANRVTSFHVIFQHIRQNTAMKDE